MKTSLVKKKKQLIFIFPLKEKEKTISTHDIK